MFEKIRSFYNEGLYNAEQVRKFAEKGVITEEQYRDIVGENAPGNEAEEE